MQMSPGTKIGRYEITRELGHGGMGAVFLAEDPVIGRRVAIKLIRLDDAGSAEQQRMLAQGFLKETRLAGVLHHPGVVGVFDAGRQDNLAYIVMEFIDGQTLDGVLRSQPAPDMAIKLDICRQAARVLDYAHAHGVIHRDIKPTNLLVQHDGAVKICDFGIAKVMQSTEFTMTQAGMAVGTPEFMSPEQVLGQALDGRSDQWSLAVVAYEMVTGARPFHAESYTQVMARIMTLDPEPACQHNPALPKEVDAVFAKAFSKKAPDRYANCSEFAEALESACTGLPAANPASATGPAVRTPSYPVPAVASPVAPTPAVPAAAAHTPTVPTPSIPSSPAPPDVVTHRSIEEPVSKSGSPAKLIAVLAALLVIAGGAGYWLFLRPSTPAPVETAQEPVPAKPPPATRAPAVRPASAAAERSKAATSQPAVGQPAVSATPAAENHVRLETEPAGAALTVDNKPDSCVSPCDMSLTAGKHNLEARKDGYYVLLKEFQVDGQQSPITFALVQKTGTVMIDSEPKGASISVNGAARPELTPAQITLPVGQYTIKWTKEGYEPAERNDVVVGTGGIGTIKATLVKSVH